MNKRIPAVLYAIGYLGLGKEVLLALFFVVFLLGREWLFGDRCENIGIWAAGALCFIMGPIDWLRARCFAKCKEVLPRKLVLGWKCAWWIVIAVIIIVRFSS